MGPQSENFILAHAERLVSDVEHVSSPVDKIAPYTIEESEQRLEPQITDTLQKIEQLPSLACPGGETVIAVTLHPEYIAKSYYPENLLKKLNLEQVGSRATLVKPTQWAKQKDPTAVRSVTLFVRSGRDEIANIKNVISSSNELGKASEDLIKIEHIEAISDIERISPVQTSGNNIRIEVVLHASSSDSDRFIIDGFGAYVRSLGLSIDTTRRIFAEGLCFMSMNAPTKALAKIADYSFLRTIREMPKLRPITRGGPNTFKLDLPNGAPMDPGLRAAVFDGGVPEDTLLEPWVRRQDAPGVGKALDAYLYHGAAVSGALLFGPLKEGQKAPVPYCYVDHYRVLDELTGVGDEDLLDVLIRIETILKSTNYQFASLSIGPFMPIEDSGEPHAWTSVLDKIFVEQGILATLAIGNTGTEDRESGNARIQPPSDSVNGMAIGAADTEHDKWKRAPYSSFGPGRAPGIIKPDVVAFGGSSEQNFNVVNAFDKGNSCPDAGTSYATPASLRTALGVRVHFGEILSPIALKALLIHGADDNGHAREEVGWGRIPLDFNELVKTDGHVARVVYQGVLSPAESIKAPIPMPPEELKGRVTIEATIAYLAPISPQDSANYTNAGLDIVFRPNDKKKSKVTQKHPDPQSFFSGTEYELYDEKLTYKAHTWETVRTAKCTKLASKLSNPRFDIHYNARDGVGGVHGSGQKINYALIVTISAPNHPELYNHIVQRYRSQLEPLRPILRVPLESS